MSNNESYWNSFCSSKSSINICKTQLGKIGNVYNNQEIANDTILPWNIPREITMKDKSKRISLNSPSSKFVKSQMKSRKRKIDSQRLAKNRRRIELLSQPKYRVQTRIEKSPSINNVTNVNINKNDVEKVGELNVDNELSTSHRFRTVTPRLLRLAQPKIYDTTFYNLHQCDNEGVEKSQAIKITKRIEELAKPKKLQFQTSKDPFKINPKALKASCTSRIEGLARPKGFSQPFSQLIQDYLDRAFVGSQ